MHGAFSKRRTSGILLMALAALLVTSFARGSHAATPGSGIKLSFQAPPGCPSQAQFESKVRELEPNAAFVEAGAIQFEVRILKNGRKFEGTFQRSHWTDSAATTGTRSLSGDTCAVAVDALALVAALAFTEVARELEEVRQKEATTVVLQSETDEPPVVLTGPPPLAKPRTDSPKRPKTLPTTSSVSLRLRGSSVLGSRLLMGGDAGYELEFPLNQRLRVSVRSSIGYFRSASEDLILEGAPYGALTLCPILFRPERAVLGICLETLFSRLVSHAGTRIPSGLPEASRLVSLAGLFVRGGTTFGPFFVDAGAGLETSLVRLEYRLVGTDGSSSDSILLSILPGPAGLLALSVGYRIP